MEDSSPNAVNLDQTLAALLFVSEEPATAERLCQACGASREDVLAALNTLAARLERQSALLLARVAGGFRLETKPQFAETIRGFLQNARNTKLSMAALEVLALIAYRQPITAVEIAEQRMVSSVSSLIRTLLDRQLIRMAGRKQVVGRPMLYRTTSEFLVHFGLDRLGDLPSLEEFTAVQPALEETILPLAAPEEV
jgi:segregation and condensation protein B